MGCYNTIRIECPNCRTLVEMQSKGGSCRLKVYDGCHVPVADALALDGQRVTCPGCNSERVVIPRMASFVSLGLAPASNFTVDGE